MPSKILRLEAVAELIVILALYANLHASWWFFAVLLLTPDLSAVGYLKSPRLGALLYNAGHSYVLPIILGSIGLATDTRVPYGVALIWAAHIAMDRALGFGLKHSDSFHHTHLGRIGKP